MGAQINEHQVKKILEYIEIAKQEGARVACGGERATEGDLAKGCFMKPTLLVDVDNHMRVAQEEIFGPVACVIKFHDEDEVLSLIHISASLKTARLEKITRRSRPWCGYGGDSDRLWVLRLSLIHI